jgi:hypothetical protein
MQVGMFFLVALMLTVLSPGCTARWHPYEDNPQRQGCGEVIGANAKPPPASSWGKEFNLWEDVISDYDSIHGETMFGFNRDAFELVWKNQHPEDCSKAKFLISGDWEEGFGSEMHVYSL